MVNRKIFVIVIVLAILAAVMGVLWINAGRDRQRLEAAAVTATKNEQVLTFTKSFIANVLQAQKEVDFDTRLKLENDVRALHDTDILAQWQKFTGSKTEAEAQTAVKDLLALLVNKL